MKAVVYDAGVLIAADRSERQVWAEHRVRLEAGVVPSVPAPVVAQVSRSSRQAQLQRFLRGCEVVPFSERDAHQVGALLERARTKDVVDASVANLAIERKADVVSDDPRDIARLLSAARSSLRVLRLR